LAAAHECDVDATAIPLSAKYRESVVRSSVAGMSLGIRPTGCQSHEESHRRGGQKVRTSRPNADQCFLADRSKRHRSPAIRRLLYLPFPPCFTMWRIHAIQP